MNSTMETSPRATSAALDYQAEQVLRLRPVDDAELGSSVSIALTREFVLLR
ncbi:MAG: hypothetical protein U5O16_24520 [Rhodococcus sp. (in: high G+C Gram-positive bacteria)]|uniref:hypothetical protein n=1 Tax=Rhodococcus sp. TaxID=1831 RepID=UPI002AD81D6D|nr:hypothetical protein [Rhodococcus sp. (in: high G+C Gram-positive bacteria)]